jgi:hypothetical protein
MPDGLAPQRLRAWTKHQAGELGFIYHDDVVERHHRIALHPTDEADLRTRVDTASDDRPCLSTLSIEGTIEQRNNDSASATGEAQRVAERERRGGIFAQVAAEDE